MAKVFIITGASKGIGVAVARHLLQQSHKVVLAARSREPLETIKKSHPGQVEYVVGDMTSSHVGSLDSQRCKYTWIYSWFIPNIQDRCLQI